MDYAAMNQAAAAWQYQELHKDRPFHDGSWQQWSAERSAAYPFHFLDGVTVFVTTTDENPGDDFLTEENAVPSASVAQDRVPDQEADSGQ